LPKFDVPGIILIRIHLD